ncbi:Ribonuclease J 2 [Lactococcus lactis]|nr:Ribonuclease J 2 [Lactococcus lactis]
MSNIKITPLGGVREFGKNMYLVEVEEQIFVLDAGLNTLKWINLVLILLFLILHIS